MSDYATLRSCPLCERFPMCDGARRVRCQFCPASHMVDCTVCETCGLCQGTHLVTDPVRARWLEENDAPSSSKS